MADRGFRPRRLCRINSRSRRRASAAAQRCRSLRWPMSPARRRSRIRGDMYGDGTIAATQIIAGSITSTQIQADSISADRLVTGTITSASGKIGALSVRRSVDRRQRRDGAGGAEFSRRSRSSAAPRWLVSMCRSIPPGLLASRLRSMRSAQRLRAPTITAAPTVGFALYINGTLSPRHRRRNLSSAKHLRVRLRRRCRHRSVDEHSDPVDGPSCWRQLYVATARVLRWRQSGERHVPDPLSQRHRQDFGLGHGESDESHLPDHLLVWFDDEFPLDPRRQKMDVATLQVIDERRDEWVEEMRPQMQECDGAGR